LPQAVGLPGASGLPQVGLPLRRIRPARSVDVMLVSGRPSVMHAGVKSHFIAACSGPWLVSGDWWGEARWHREVWEVETSEGVLYQLTRHNGQWQLEGVFG
jgi:protein ImuB